MKKLILATYKILLPIAIITAISVQVIHFSKYDETFVISNYFSQYTIISNLIAVVALLLSTRYLSKTAPAHVNIIRTLAAVNLVITGIVYHIFLSGGQPTIPWANFVVHTLAPVLLFIDWFLDYPRPSITLKQSYSVPMFLCVYIVYTITRGQIVDWYPYPFADVDKLGFLKVILIGICFIIFGTIISIILTQLPRRFYRTSKVT